MLGLIQVAVVACFTNTSLSLDSDEVGLSCVGKASSKASNLIVFLAGSLKSTRNLPLIDISLSRNTPPAHDSTTFSNVQRVQSRPSSCCSPFANELSVTVPASGGTLGMASGNERNGPACSRVDVWFSTKEQSAPNKKVSDEAVILDITPLSVKAPHEEPCSIWRYHYDQEVPDRPMFRKWCLNRSSLSRRHPWHGKNLEPVSNK